MSRVVAPDGAVTMLGPVDPRGPRDPVAAAILGEVLAAMQAAEEIGGPDSAAYDELMSAIAEEARRRLVAHRTGLREAGIQAPRDATPRVADGRQRLKAARDARPGDLYGAYQAALTRHGYTSKEAKQAFRAWAIAARRLPATEQMRADLTPRPFDDRRPLSTIYPRPRAK